MSTYSAQFDYKKVHTGFQSSTSKTSSMLMELKRVYNRSSVPGIGSYRLTVWGSLALLRRAFPMADRIALQATVTNFTFCKSGRANHRFTLIRYRKITTSNHSARSRPCWSKYHQTILMLSVANWASFGVRGRS